MYKRCSAGVIFLVRSTVHTETASIKLNLIILLLCFQTIQSIECTHSRLNDSSRCGDITQGNRAQWFPCGCVSGITVPCGLRP